MRQGWVRTGIAAVALCAGLGLFACADEATRLDEHMSRGEAYLEEEQYPEAVIEFKNVLQLDPNHGAAHFGLAKSYLGLERPRDAYWELQETTRLDPDNLEARLQYGQFLLLGQQAELELAVEQADAILELEADRADAFVVKGRALERLERGEEALVAYQAAAAADPEAAAPILLLANYYRQAEDLETAEALYQKLTDVEATFATHAALASFYASQERSADAEAAYRKASELATEEEQVGAVSLLANFLFTQERQADAEVVLLEAIEARPEELDLSLALARLYVSQGEPERADAIILKASEASPGEAEPHLVLSSYRGSQGDLDGALLAAEAAIAAEPDNTRAQLRKAELMIDLGFRDDDPTRLAEGRSIVAEVLKDDELSPEGLFVKAKLDLAEQDPDSAEEALRQVVEARPDWAQAHFLLASTLFLKQEPRDARAAALRALELNADLVEASAMLARSHAALGDHEQAIQAGRRVIERNPADVKMTVLVAQSMVRTRRLTEAAELLSAVPEEDRDAEVHFALGRVLRVRGDAAGARAEFERALAMAPAQAAVLRALFRLDMEQDRLAESVARTDAAVEANPDNPRLLQLRGEVALYSQDYETAEQSFKRAIELDPNDLRGYENLARYLMVTGRAEEVVETYEKALEGNPESATLHLVLGSLYELRGRRAEAVARYEEAVRLDASLAVAKNNLAYLLAETGGDLDRALDLAQQAKEQLPDNANTADTLGWVLYKRNVPSAAIGYLREAERGLDPQDPNLGAVRQHLALAYQANGEPDHAREVIDRALAGREPGAEAEPTWAVELRAMRDRLDSEAAAEG